MAKKGGRSGVPDTSNMFRLNYSTLWAGMSQEMLFKEFYKNRGWEALRVYREEGKSAHVDAIARRYLFRQLIENSGKHQFDVVSVHTLDRWCRNLKVMLESINILGKNNVGFISITENLDWSTPEGRLTANMLGVLAQFYSESTGKTCQQWIRSESPRGKAYRRHPLRL
ncbi:recombinase family protein [Chloroflexota bacterium]